MKAYLKLKKIDCEIDETTVFKDGLPLKNKDYTLLIKVQLKSKEMTQVEADDDDEDVYYNFETVGEPRLIPDDFSAADLEETPSVASLEGPQ